MEIPAYLDPNLQVPDLGEGIKISPENRMKLGENKIKEKCYEFEAVLINSMLKSMRKTIQKSGLVPGGNAEDVYTSLLDREYAIILSKNSSTSIADALFKQLTQEQK